MIMLHVHATMAIGGTRHKAGWCNFCRIVRRVVHPRRNSWAVGRDFTNQNHKSCRHTAAAASVRAMAAVTPSPARKKPRRSYASKSTSDDGIREEVKALILSKLHAANAINGNASTCVDTVTLGGWCLVDGLTHCAAASDGILLRLIREHGPPTFHIGQIIKKATGENSCDRSSYSSFQSLCRIVSGQQLAGSAAKTIYRRLLSVVDATEDDPSNLTPDRILSIVENGNVEADLRAPAGLSNSKCKCIVAIAESFKDGTLSDSILLGGEAADDELRQLLLGIKGLGPWSVDMFLLFQCHKSDILPIGDLAFRNGTQNLWGVKGNAKGGGLCQKKDEQLVKDLHEPFAPYRSLSSYYMYKCSGMK